MTNAIGRRELVPEQGTRAGHGHRHQRRHQRQHHRGQRRGQEQACDIAERQDRDCHCRLPPPERQPEPRRHTGQEKGSDPRPRGRRFPQPGPCQDSVVQIRLDGRPFLPRPRLDKEKDDPVGDQALERLRLPLLDGFPDVSERDHLVATRKLRPGDADQHPPAPVDGDLVRLYLQEGGGEREPVRRHASLANPNEERHSSDDTVGVSRGEHVSDGFRVVGEAGQRSGERPCFRKCWGSLGERRPRSVRGPRRRGGARGLRRAPIGELQADRKHDTVGQRDRLTQERITGRATRRGPARLSEWGVDADDGGACTRQTSDEAGENNAVPSAGAEPGLTRRVADDDDQRRARRRGLARAKPPVVHRPIERNEPGASESQDTEGHQGGCEADRGGQRHGLHHRVCRT